MPFTLAHPAAAIALRRLLGGAGVVSALVIGSVAPDLRYFVPLPVPRSSTHSLAGLLWFCLPAGVAAYVLFHLALKQPLLALLPDAWQARLASLVPARPALPAVPWWAVVVSVVAGAASHIAWDSFTHGNAPVVEAFPSLRVLLFIVSGYPVYVYKVLQHGSTLIGVSLLVLWSARWLRRTTPAGRATPPRLTPAARALVIGAIVATAAAVALAAADAGAGMPARVNLRVLERYAGRAVAPGLSTLGIGVLLYCAAWHGLRAARRSARS